MRPDHPRCATPTEVVMWGGVPDVVNHARFRQNWLRGFGSLKGQNLPFSSGSMSYTTGYGYRPTCNDTIGMQGYRIR